VLKLCAFFREVIGCAMKSLVCHILLLLFPEIDKRF